jgi:hypothetical protein
MEGYASDAQARIRWRGPTGRFEAGRWNARIRAYLGAVRLVSSVVVTVPSDDRVTVCSFDLTAPVLLTLVLLVWDTSWAHPTTRNDDAKADIAKQVTIMRLFMESGYRVG